MLGILRQLWATDNLLFKPSDLFSRCWGLTKYSDIYPVRSGSLYSSVRWIRDAVLSMKTRHIILQYVQRHSKDRRNILRYNMHARLLCQFVVFTSAHSFLETIRSGLMIVQRAQSLEPPLPRAARLGWLWQLNWASFGYDLRCLSSYLSVSPSHLTSRSNSGLRSLLLVKIAGLSRLGGETHLVFRVSRELMGFIYMWELTNTRFALVLPASVTFLFKWSSSHRIRALLIVPLGG